MKTKDIDFFIENYNEFMELLTLKTKEWCHINDIKENPMDDYYYDGHTFQSDPRIYFLDNEIGICWEEYEDCGDLNDRELKIPYKFIKNNVDNFVKKYQKNKEKLKKLNTELGFLQEDLDIKKIEYSKLISDMNKIKYLNSTHDYDIDNSIIKKKQEKATKEKDITFAKINSIQEQIKELQNEN